MSKLNFSSFENLVNLFTSIKQAIDNAVGKMVSPELLKDTVGWTGKNLVSGKFQTQTVNGITYTVNDDGSVNINGTATADSYISSDSFVLKSGSYIANGVDNGSDDTYYYDASKVGAGSRVRAKNGDQLFTLSEDTELKIWINVKNGVTVSNVVIKPMLRDASVADSSFEASHDSVDYVKANRNEVVDTIGWSCKNIGKFLPYGLTGDPTNGYSLSPTNMGSSLIAPIEHNKSYISSKKSGQGNRFRIILFHEYPTYAMQADALQEVNDATATKFTVNNTDYNYMVFTYDFGNVILQDMAEAIIRDAAIADGTYEPHHESVKQTLRDAEVIEGKNLLTGFVNNTEQGITFTVDNNGVIDANGTAENNAWIKKTDNFPTLVNGTSYILSGAESANLDAYVIGDNAGTEFEYCHDTGSGATFTYDSSKPIKRIQFGVRSGQTVSSKKIYPMLRHASESDPTFEPYYIPLKDSKVDRAEQRVLGAKNLLPFPYQNTSSTVDGITFTVNENGSVTLNGTASGSGTSRFTFLDANSSKEAVKKLLGKNLILTGAISDKCFLVISPWSGETYRDDGDGVYASIPSNATGLLIQIRVNSGTTCNNEVVYPMLRLASDPDDTYQPYAMTNRELTEMFAVKESAVTTENTTEINQLYKVGKVVTMSLVIGAGLNIEAWTTLLGTIPEGFRPPTYLQFNIFESGDPTPRVGNIQPNGKIFTSPSKENAGVLRMCLTWITKE